MYLQWYYIYSIPLFKWPLWLLVVRAASFVNVCHWTNTCNWSFSSHCWVSKLSLHTNLGVREWSVTPTAHSVWPNRQSYLNWLIGNFGAITIWRLLSKKLNEYCLYLNVGTRSQRSKYDWISWLVNKSQNGCYGHTFAGGKWDTISWRLSTVKDCVLPYARGTYDSTFQRMGRTTGSWWSSFHRNLVSKLLKGWTSNRILKQNVEV